MSWKNIIPILKHIWIFQIFLNLQMNYIFLGSAIERYGVLRYGKNNQFAYLRELSEKYFLKKLFQNMRMYIIKDLQFFQMKILEVFN